MIRSIFFLFLTALTNPALAADSFRAQTKALVEKQKPSVEKCQAVKKELDSWATLPGVKGRPGFQNTGLIVKALDLLPALPRDGESVRDLFLAQASPSRDDVLEYLKVFSTFDIQCSVTRFFVWKKILATPASSQDAALRARVRPLMQQELRSSPRTPAPLMIEALRLALVTDALDAGLIKASEAKRKSLSNLRSLIMRHSKIIGDETQRWLPKSPPAAAGPKGPPSDSQEKTIEALERDPKWNPADLRKIVEKERDFSKADHEQLAAWIRPTLDSSPEN